MTEEQYNKAHLLKSEISNLHGLIEFVASSNVKFCLGQEEDSDGEIVVPIEEIYLLDRDVHGKLLELCIEAREEFLAFLKEKLETIEREFDYV